jgi:hypothetical protein
MMSNCGRRMVFQEAKAIGASFHSPSLSVRGEVATETAQNRQIWDFTLKPSSPDSKAKSIWDLSSRHRASFSPNQS